MSRKTPKEGNENAAPGRIKTGMAVCGLALLVPALAFMSMELAVLAIGFLALAVFVMLDDKRRRRWESKLSSRLKTIDKNQEKLNNEVTRNRVEINALKKDILTIAEENAQKHMPKDRIDPEVLRSMADNIRRTGAPLGSAAEARALDDPLGLETAKKRAFSHETLEFFANDDPDAGAAELSEVIVKELVHHAVRNERIEVFCQPIVRLPQRKARFFEMFARIRARSGLYLPASRYMAVAEQDGVINNIDTMLLMECLKTIRDTAHLEKATPFFLNITTATLKNKPFMKQLLAFLSKNRDLAPRLVFEIKQSDFKDMHPAILEILRGLGSLGCNLSVDHVDNFNFDIRQMQVLKVRFVKVSAKTLLKKAKDNRRFTEMWRLKRKLEGNGIGFVVEKIESEFALKELLDLDINYGQGYLFGKPALMGAYRQKIRGTKAA